ncbi:MAG: cell division protein ZapA [Alphaproteobacteria bacterium]
MAQVDITINGRDYSIACDDGQEDHLLRLGEYVDKKVTEMVAEVGQVGDTRLLVMASLLIADDLSEAFEEIAALEKGSGRKAPGVPKSVVEGIDGLAERIENIAATLERT